MLPSDYLSGVLSHLFKVICRVRPQDPELVTVIDDYLSELAACIPVCVSLYLALCTPLLFRGPFERPLTDPS